VLPAKIARVAMSFKEWILLCHFGFPKS